MDGFSTSVASSEAEKITNLSSRKLCMLVRAMKTAYRLRGGHYPSTESALIIIPVADAVKSMPGVNPGLCMWACRVWCVLVSSPHNCIAFKATAFSGCQPPPKEKAKCSCILKEIQGGVADGIFCLEVLTQVHRRQLASTRAGEVIELTWQLPPVQQSQIWPPHAGAGQTSWHLTQPAAPPT